MAHLRIVAVLDLLHGQVVRGVAGRRDEYRPVVSRLTESTAPLSMACAIREHLGISDLYLADLDAIRGAPPSLDTYGALLTAGFALWVDAGLRTARDAEPLAALGVPGIVAGLETLAGPAALGDLCGDHGPERILFSLDLKGGQPLADLSAWQAAGAWAVAERAVACGVRRLIVLDLAHVGMASGTGTEAFCARLTEAHPDLEVTAGGGVRDAADLRRLAQCGVRAALVASALHDGRLSRADLLVS
jgi:phosphoribosylformimino-5-aminoimidazole carboxamide ribotide isomerase